VTVSRACSVKDSPRAGRENNMGKIKKGQAKSVALEKKAYVIKHSSTRPGGGGGGKGENRGFVINQRLGRDRGGLGLNMNYAEKYTEAVQPSEDTPKKGGLCPINCEGDPLLQPT